MKKLKINWVLWIQGLLFVAIAGLVLNVTLNIGGIFSSIGRFFGIISPVIVGAAIAYMLSRPCRWVQGKIEKVKYPIVQKRSRGLAVLVIYTIMVLIVSLLLRTLVPILFNNVMDFIDFVPELTREVETFVIERGWASNDVVQEFFDDFDIQTALIPAAQALDVVANFAISTALWIFDAVLALIISIYMLLYKDTILKTISRITNLIMKSEKMQTLQYYCKKADDLFYKFIGAQFLDSCIMGGLSIILLWALDVRFAVFLGIFLGVANMIPKFGSIVASIIVIALTFITGGVNQGIWTAILLTILQQFDGNVIGPLIMGDALKINPILVFVALLIGAAYFGLLGMFLSIPVMALIKIIIINIIEAKEAKMNKEVAKQ